jgi:hypothetical protein
LRSTDGRVRAPTAPARSRQGFTRGGTGAIYRKVRCERARPPFSLA